MPPPPTLVFLDLLSGQGRGGRRIEKTCIIRRSTKMLDPFALAYGCTQGNRRERAASEGGPENHPGGRRGAPWRRPRLYQRDRTGRTKSNGHLTPADLRSEKSFSALPRANARSSTSRQGAGFARRPALSAHGAEREQEVVSNRKGVNAVALRGREGFPRFFSYAQRRGERPCRAARASAWPSARLSPRASGQAWWPRS